jgi:hypothetical protein
MNKTDIFIVLLFAFVFAILGFAGWHMYNAVHFLVTVILAQPL